MQKKAIEQKIGLRTVLMLAFLALGLVGFKGNISKIPDAKIETVSLARLHMDTRLDAQKITVKSNKHVVTLSGTVETLQEKFLAEKIVGSTVVGVTAIINTIKVGPLSVTDDGLVTQVRAALQREPALKGAEITAEVSNGVVRLSGTVKTLSKALLAREIVASVPGVTDFASDLKVVPEKLPDGQISQQVANYLEFNPLETGEIKFSVKDGVVRLSGKVHHFNHLLTIFQDIQDMRGIVAVVTTIEVEG